MSACYSKEQTYRLKILKLHKKKLGRNHQEIINAEEALADCYLNSFGHFEAKDLYKRVLSWRSNELDQRHVDTVRAIECLGICYAHLGQDAEAEVAYLDAIRRQSDADARLLDNMSMSLWE